MKISFEKWIEENKLPQSAVELFKESIVCYKVSAYKSAFLMAYSGLQIIIKERLLTSDCKPNNMEDGQWNNIRQKLGNEDKWDAEVFDCVNRNGESRLFLINDAITAQYKLLKTYRNICAHGKSGEISYYHIELLWGFIQENYTKFVINGGKDGMMQMIVDHFDITLNEPGKDIAYLVNNIEATISDDELDEFINKLYAFSDEKVDSINCFFTSKSPVVKLWDELMCENNRVRDGILLFVKKSSIEIITDFVAKYPQTVNELFEDKSFARKMWTGEMFEPPLNEKGWFRMLEFLVTYDKIPDNEKDGFYKKVYKFQGKHYYNSEVEVLKKTKYFEYLSNELFDISNYNDFQDGVGIRHANSIAGIFIRYIDDFGLDIKSVKCINCIFGFAHYGEFVEKIRSWMKKEDHIDKYKEIVEANQLNDYSLKFLEDT